MGNTLNKPLVNFVSGDNPAIWDRELPSNLPQRFVHTREPVTADIHVIYGRRSAFQIPNRRENTVFVAAEPPEIRTYSPKLLSQYGAIIGPEFEYLRRLPHFFPVTAIAPWSVGTKKTESASNNDLINLTRNDFREGFLPATDFVSAIVSEKARTPMQQQRLRLVDYLETHLSCFEAYGPRTRPLEDKAEVLSLSRYHLAVENSCHPGYWTEKLADPMLMNNVTFYAGDPSVGNFFGSQRGIIQINPWKPEESYRTIAHALELGLWHKVKPDLDHNRHLVLSTYSFHRQLSSFLAQRTWSTVRGGKTVIRGEPTSGRYGRLIGRLHGLVRR